MRQLLFSVLMLSGFTPYAQTVLFSEDFETSPVTNFLNTWTSETALSEGSPPCGIATRGNASDLNSTSIDFNSTQNSGYFLGANPESPCGGFYNASLHSPTQDFSGAADSIVVSVRYFKSTTLGWGPTELELVFDNGTTTDTIRDEFVTTDSWDMVTYKLPTSMHAANIDITTNMGGGEGVAIDDVTITRYLDTSGEIETVDSPVNIYPNPANGFVIISNVVGYKSWEIRNVEGKLIKNGTVTQNHIYMDVNDIENGLYLFQFFDQSGLKATKKVSIEH